MKIVNTEVQPLLVKAPDAARMLGVSEKTLKKLPIPCDVGYAYSTNPYQEPECYRLEWRKWKGKKRICIVACLWEDTPEGTDIVEHVTPFEEWSGEQRIKMIEYVPQLFEAALRETKAFIASTQDKEDK